MSNKSNQIKSNSNENENVNKKFAIFITSYNYAEYIGQAIESVINQTDPDWHLYIIDDCSTDNTEEIVKKYLEKDSRISWKKHEKNIGSVPTIIEGFSEIDADYISDDWLEPNFVADAKKAFAENPEIPFCALGWKIFWHDKKTTQNYIIPFAENFNSKVYLSPYLVFENFINLNFLVFNKNYLNFVLNSLKQQAIKQELEAFFIKNLEKNFGAGYLNNHNHGYWRWHQNQLSQQHIKNYQAMAESFVEPLLFCRQKSEQNLTNLTNLSTRFMSLIRILGMRGIPYKEATQWLLSDLGKPFAENFGNLDIEFIKANNLEKSLLCLAICVWSSFIFSCNSGGWEQNIEIAKKQLGDWILEIQKQYNLRSIKEIYAEANKLYDGLFMPLIK